MADSPHPPDRQVLSSWKEIASYLKVDVRTVQRWQKRGDLPIYRHPTGERSHPYAYSDELDRWVTEGGPHAPHDRDAPQDIARSGATAPPRKGTAPVRRSWHVALGGAAVTVLAAWAWLGWSSLSCTPAGARLEGTSFEVLDADGQACWAKPVPEFAEAQATGLTMPLDDWRGHDLDGDREPEVLLNVPAWRSRGTTGRLVVFDAAGRERWSHDYGRPLRWRDREFSGLYDGRLLRPVEVDGRAHVLAVAWHNVWFPAQVALLEASSGRLVDEYWHPGALHFANVTDLDADGRREVLLAGVSNPGPGLGHAVLVALALPFSRTPVGTGGMADFTGGRERAYRVFPRPDLCSVSGRIPLVTELTVEGSERVYVRVGCEESVFVYTLDAGLTTIDARFSDNVFAHHERLRRRGDLDHELSDEERRCLQRVLATDTAVDGNAPDLATVWSACE